MYTISIFFHNIDTYMKFTSNLVKRGNTMLNEKREIFNRNKLSNKFKPSIMTSFIAFGFSACAPMTIAGPPPITEAEIAAADYGTPPPENYEELIKENISAQLIDPTSPLFEVGSPVKGYTNKSNAFETDKAFGWQVCGTVNSKNRMGGYTGKVPFYALFQNGQLTNTIIGEVALSANRYNRSYINMSIESSCNRKVD